MNRYKVYIHVDYYIEIEASSEKEAKLEAMSTDPAYLEVLKRTVRVEVDPTFKPLTEEAVAAMTPQEAWEKFVGNPDICDFVEKVRGWSSSIWDTIKWISQGCFDCVDDIEDVCLKYAHEIVWLKNYDPGIASAIAHKLREYVLSALKPQAE